MQKMSVFFISRAKGRLVVFRMTLCIRHRNCPGFHARSEDQTLSSRASCWRNDFIFIACSYRNSADQVFEAKVKKHEASTTFAFNSNRQLESGGRTTATTASAASCRESAWSPSPWRQRANDCLERCREHDGEDCGDFTFHFDTKVKHKKKTTLRIE